MKKTFTPVTTIPGVDTHKILARAHAGEIRVVSTACGFQTSRTCAQVRAGCTWRWSPMRIPVGSWAGRWTRIWARSMVARALKMAHTLRGEVPDGVVVHADRGTELTSDDMFEVCRGLEMVQSVGRKGVCWDTVMASECVGDVEDFSTTTGVSGPPGLRRG